MAARFVIHVHSGHGPEHYDLMLERGNGLATWRLPRSPADLGEGRELTAVKIPDHRLAYLDYEGPVSRGRGEVTRFDAGDFDLLFADQSRWEFRLAGRRVQGRFELRRRGEGNEWRLARLTDPRAARR